MWLCRAVYIGDILDILHYLLWGNGAMHSHVLGILDNILVVCWLIAAIYTRATIHDMIPSPTWKNPMDASHEFQVADPAIPGPRYLKNNLI